MIKIGVFPTVIEQTLEHGTVIQSYAVPACVYLIAGSQQFFLYSTGIKKPDGNPSRTTAKHVNAYRKLYNGSIVIHCEIPHEELCELVATMRNSHKCEPGAVEAKTRDIYKLYGEN